MSYIVCDIGGTKTRVASSEDLESFGEVIKFKTPRSAREGVKMISEAASSLQNSPIRSVAVGVRGFLSYDKSMIVHDTALSSWTEEPLADMLSDALDADVVLENDTALAGLGEAHYGAGIGYDIMVYHTVSTGVGGVKIEDGVIDRSASGFEPGHQILDIDKTILGVDVSPTLERLVSGSAVAERMGVQPYEIPQDDKIWDQLAFFLAHGIRNTVLYWSPDVIVLGGSMIVGDPRILLDDIVRHANEIIGDVTECPLILDAKLGDNGGLYGAMALLGQKV